MGRSSSGIIIVREWFRLLPDAGCWALSPPQILLPTSSAILRTIRKEADVLIESHMYSTRVEALEWVRYTTIHQHLKVLYVLYNRLLLAVEIIIS
jgi:hypothetical protein